MNRTELVVPPEPGKRYTAAMDPGTRGNAWTWGIAETEDNIRFKLVKHGEFVGSSSTPLVPGDVFDALLPDLLAYDCASSVKTDQWAVDALREIALMRGIGLSPITISASNKVKLYESLRVRLDSSYLELPHDTTLRSDLLGVKKRLTTDGFKVILPVTADGRHCDYAAMLALLCGDYLQSSAEVKVEAVVDDDDEPPPYVQDEWDWVGSMEEHLYGPE